MVSFHVPPDLTQGRPCTHTPATFTYGIAFFHTPAILTRAAASVCAELTFDQALVPTELIARTQKKYSVPGFRPAIVLGDTPDAIVVGDMGLEPQPTSYPVMGDPPLGGIAQVTTTEVVVIEDMAGAAGGVGVLSVVPVAEGLQALYPAELCVRANT